VRGRLTPSHSEASRTELQQFGDVRGEAFPHSSLGLIAAATGDVASAYHHLLEAFESISKPRLS